MAAWREGVVGRLRMRELGRNKRCAGGSWVGGKFSRRKKNVEYGASYALMEDGVERGDLGPP